MSPFGRSDSPGPEWYEAPDPIEDDEDQDDDTDD